MHRPSPCSTGVGLQVVTKDELLEEAERIIEALRDQQAMPDEGMDEWIEEWKQKRKE